MFKVVSCSYESPISCIYEKVDKWYLCAFYVSPQHISVECHVVSVSNFSSAKGSRSQSWSMGMSHVVH